MGGWLRRGRLLVVLVFSAAAVAGAVGPPATAGVTFTVTTAADSGVGSLRAAILAANASAGKDTIAFSIGLGAHTIALKSGLPSITDPVAIDGTTQPGFTSVPLIRL